MGLRSNGPKSFPKRFHNGNPCEVEERREEEFIRMQEKTIAFLTALTLGYRCGSLNVAAAKNCGTALSPILS